MLLVRGCRSVLQVRPGWSGGTLGTSWGVGLAAAAEPSAQPRGLGPEGVALIRFFAQPRFCFLKDHFC